MLSKLKWWLFATSSWFLISGCTPKPPDVFVFEYLAQHLSTDPTTQHLILTPSPTCIEKISEPECGHGVSVVLGAEVFVGEAKEHWFKGKPWSQLKQEAVYCPAEECYAPLSQYIINSCEKMHCNDQVAKFKIKLDALSGIIGAVKNQ